MHLWPHLLLRWEDHLGQECKIAVSYHQDPVLQSGQQSRVCSLSQSLFFFFLKGAPHKRSPPKTPVPTSQLWCHHASPPLPGYDLITGFSYTHTGARTHTQGKAGSCGLPCQQPCTLAPWGSSWPRPAQVTAASFQPGASRQPCLSTPRSQFWQPINLPIQDRTPSVLFYLLLH